MVKNIIIKLKLSIEQKISHTTKQRFVKTIKNKTLILTFYFSSQKSYRIIMYKAINNAKVAKIVKLNHNKKTQLQLSNRPHLGSTSSFENESFRSSSSTDMDDMTNEQTFIRLFVIKDYMGMQVYGHMNVQRGQLIRLVCESEDYYMGEDEFGNQGFVAKECCINLDETVDRARLHMLDNKSCKVTSL